MLIQKYSVMLSYHVECAFGRFDYCRDVVLAENKRLYCTPTIIFHPNFSNTAQRVDIDNTTLNSLSVHFERSKGTQLTVGCLTQ